MKATCINCGATLVDKWTTPTTHLCEDCAKDYKVGKSEVMKPITLCLACGRPRPEETLSPNFICSECSTKFSFLIEQTKPPIKPALTLKMLLDCVEVESQIATLTTMGDPHIQCPKCLFIVEVGILVVAWDPPSKKYKLQIMCQHCVKEST